MRAPTPMPRSARPGGYSAPGDIWSSIQGGLGRNANGLIGLGSQLMAGNMAGVGQGWAQGNAADRDLNAQQEQLAQAEADKNSTLQWLQQKAQTDPRFAELASGMESGALAPRDAFLAGMDYLKPVPPKDLMSVSEGATIFDPNTRQPVFSNPKGGPDIQIDNNIGGTDKYYDGLDSALAGQDAELINQGRNARSNNIRLGQLEQHLATAPQGAQGAIVQFAGSIGLPVEGLDDLQAAQALINQMVPGQRPPGSGTMSDADLILFKQSLPAIINQPGGNAYIIQTTKAINEYTIALADIAQAVANRQISPAKGRELQASVPNPLANFRAPAGGPAPAAGQQPQTKVINGVTYVQDANGDWYTQ